MGVVPCPKIEPIGSNWYRLIADYIYEWEKDGVEYRMIVPTGFENDLASVPRILWWYISPFDLAHAAVPHDWIYHHRGKLPDGSHLKHENGEWKNVGVVWERRDADRLFARIMREANVAQKKRRRAFLAVRIFGWWPWRKKTSAD